MNTNFQLYYCKGSVETIDDKYSEYTPRLLGIFLISPHLSIEKIEEKINSLYNENPQLNKLYKINMKPTLSHYIYAHHAKLGDKVNTYPPLSLDKLNYNGSFNLWIEERAANDNCWLHDCVWSQHTPIENSFKQSKRDSRNFTIVHSNYIHTISSDSDISNLTFNTDNLFCTNSSITSF